MDDAVLVRAEYADERKLDGRKAAYRSRGIDAHVADVAALPFDDGAFDGVVAAWMRFHAPDLDRALGEIARVLADDGRLVAAASGDDHVRELGELLGVYRPPASFRSENGEELLRPRFSRVERRDAYGWVVFPSRDEAQAYVDAGIAYVGRRLPDVEGPLRVRRAPTAFVADR